MSPTTQLQKAFTLDTAKAKGFISAIVKTKGFILGTAKMKAFILGSAKTKAFIQAHLDTAKTKNETKQKVRVSPSLMGTFRANLDF